MVAKITISSANVIWDQYQVGGMSVISAEDDKDANKQVVIMLHGEG